MPDLEKNVGELQDRIEEVEKESAVILTTMNYQEKRLMFLEKSLRKHMVAEEQELRRISDKINKMLWTVYGMSATLAVIWLITRDITSILTRLLT